LLASEYGWTHEYIYTKVYFDELFYLSEKIKGRRKGHYRMLLAITHNPHVKDQDALWRLLEEGNPAVPSAEFDAAGFERLKMAMSKSPHVVVKE